MASPAVHNSSLVAELTYALRGLDDLNDRERRLAAYVLVAMRYDAEALRLEKIRRSIFNMGERHAQNNRKCPVAVDIMAHEAESQCRTVDRETGT